MNNKLKQMTGLLLVLCLSTSCASKGKSLAMGGTLGAGLGASIGGIMNPGKNGQYRTRNVIIGAGVGGLAGVLAGNFAHNSIEKREKEAFEKGKDTSNNSKNNGAYPELKEPKVESRWVEGRVQGNRYIEGHFEYVILEQARWQVSE